MVQGPVNQGREQPNVLMIVTDDQGPWALGAAGNDEIYTPNIDSLADEGVRFTNFYCTSPVCSPARASLLTGLVPSQHGVHDFVLAGNMPPNPISYLEGRTGFSQVLADRGYVCGLSGKWHLGDSMSPQQGYSHWYALAGGASDYRDSMMIRDGFVERSSEYLTDLITADASKFIKGAASDGRPFLCSVHYTAPHSPWVGQHPYEYLDLYKDCDFLSCPQEPPHPWGPSSAQTSVATAVRDPVPSLKGYFAATTAMDEGVGQLLRLIRSLGIERHTLVFFVSDNGFNCGHHGIWGKGNGTFPQNMYEESVKVPAVMRWPGVLPAGGVVDTLVSAYDWFPTVVEMADPGIADHPGRPGRSLLGLAQHNAGDLTHEEIVVYNEYGPVRMIRTGRWKYVHRYPYGPHELYDLQDDPSERYNRADDSKYKGVGGDLRASLERWFQKYVNPDVDGLKQGVIGSGQGNLVGQGGGGREAFYPPTSYEYPVIDLRRFPGPEHPGMP